MDNLRLLKGTYTLLCLAILIAVFGLIFIYNIEDDDQYLNDLRKAYPPNSGYLLATHYSEMLTNSTANLFSLQCWASSLPVSVRVVEPFLHYGSYLGFELNPNNERKERTLLENRVKLFDIFDVKRWRRYAAKSHLAGMVSWNFFLKNAPRQLILVDKTCSEDRDLCMSCKESDFYESPHFRMSSYRFANRYNFTIVRRVCYSDRHRYSKREFQNLIYGPYEPDESVVIFNHFGGLQLKVDRKTISVDLKRCTKFEQVIIPTSQKILGQSSKYIRKFMSDGTKTNGYISVMLKVEAFVKRRQFDGKSKMWQMTSMHRCIGKIVKRVRALKRKIKISSVFLTTDIGKYGVYRFGDDYVHDGVFQAGLKHLYEGLFNKKLNLFTSGIESVASVNTSQYVSLLETTVAANGTCLVLAGGGNYQRIASDMYRNKFKRTKRTKMCGIETIGEC